MTYYTLDDDEQRERLRATARNTLNKTRNINIRLSERDLHRLKAKAIEEGIPYQTLASSILHKSASRLPRRLTKTISPPAACSSASARWDRKLAMLVSVMLIAGPFIYVHIKCTRARQLRQ